MKNLRMVLKLLKPVSGRKVEEHGNLQKKAIDTISGLNGSFWWEHGRVECSVGH